MPALASGSERDTAGVGPVLLLASERSGTNLLRVMFDAHSQISGPSAPHFLRVFSFFRILYGDLAKDRNARGFITDCITLARAHVVPWPIEPDPDACLANSPRRTQAALVGQLYCELAYREGMASWFCKEAELWRFTDDLIDAYPTARVLHLYRDGRDVALSAIKSGRMPWTWAQMARQWRSQQQACRSAMARAAVRTRTSRLSYEDLVADPAGSLERVCRELGIPFEEAMVQTSDNVRARRESLMHDMWGNIDKPVLASNRQKFRTEADPKDVAVFEAIAGDELVELGYECGSTERRELGPAAYVVDELRGLGLRLRAKPFDEALRARRRAIIKAVLRRALSRLSPGWGGSA